MYLGGSTFTADQYKMKEETINHPSYYKAGGIEAIDIVESFGLGFHLGNAVTYILGAGRKTDDPTEDIKKAVWYLERYTNEQNKTL